MQNLFDIQSRVVVITGGYGVLARAIALYLAEQGARVVALGRKLEEGAALQAELNRVGEGLFVQADVLDKEQLISAREQVLAKYGTVDVLINAAGGNIAGANIQPDQSFMDLSADAMRQVVDLNLMGTVLPTQVFGEVFTRTKEGCIVNFCSEAALRPLTRVMGYGAAKAAIANYTKYMATELSTKVSPKIRVNAIVPGFLLTKQNHSLLINEDGSLTERSKKIIAHTPMGRFSQPEELFTTIHYLIAPGSSFVTGTLALVDGGFDAFSI